jgi:arsenate reductase-like glutaredoxin family protein
MPHPSLARAADGGAAHRPGSQLSKRGVRLPPAGRSQSAAGAGSAEELHLIADRPRHGSRSADLPGGDSSLPLDMWNTVVAKNTPQPNPRLDDDMPAGTTQSSEQPFNTILSRSYSSTLDKLVRPSGTGSGRMPDIPRSQTLAPLKKPALPTVDEEGEQFRMENMVRGAAAAVPSRGDAILLMQALEEMQTSIRDSLGGAHPDEIAMDAAKNGDANLVMEVLEPKIYSVDVILNELVKQVGVGCQERGQLLEACRTHFLAMMSISAAAMSNLSALCDKLQAECDTLQQRLGPLDVGHQHAVHKISALELELQESKNMVKTKESELEVMRQSLQKTKQSEEVSRGKKELMLQEKIDELNDLNSLLKSKLAVADNQLKHAEHSNGVFQALAQELQERIRRDANSMDALNETIARQKLSLWWLRCLVQLRRDRTKNKKNATTQDGTGLDHAVTGDVDGSEAGSEGVEGGGGGPGGPAGRSSRPGRGGGGVGQIPFSSFWQGMVRQAEMMDLHRKEAQFRLEKKVLLERIAALYTEKIMIDELVCGRSV